MADNLLVNISGGTATMKTEELSGAIHVQVVEPKGVEGTTLVEVPPPGRGATATLTNVAYATSSGTLKAANANRRALILVNDSDGVLYVKYGATASITSYCYKLNPGEAFRETQYTGLVDGIWAGGTTGNCRVTEITT